MKLCCLVKTALELDKPGFPRGMSRGCAGKIHTRDPVLGAVPAASIHGLFKDRCYDTALVWPRAVHVWRVDPPVCKNGTVTVASIWWKKKKEATVYIIQATIICRPWFDFVLIISSFDKRCPCFFSISVLDFLLHHPNLLFLNEWRRRKTSLTWLTPSRLPSLDSFCFFTAPDTEIDYTFFVAWQQDETFPHAFATGSRRLTPPLITLFPCSATTLILLFPNSPFALAYFCFEFCSALPIRFRNCLVYSRLVAGLHVTSRRHCWWSTTKAFLSSEN